MKRVGIALIGSGDEGAFHWLRRKRPLGLLRAALYIKGHIGYSWVAADESFLGRSFSLMIARIR
ncbi:MAG: hypothetical protein ACPL7J_12000, partial [Desulfomonilaceae bacterium]